MKTYITNKIKQHKIESIYNSIFLHLFIAFFIALCLARSWLARHISKFRGTGMGVVAHVWSQISCPSLKHPLAVMDIQNHSSKRTVTRMHRKIS